MAVYKQTKVDPEVFCKLWNAGYSHAELSQKMGISLGYITALRQRYNLPRRNSRDSVPIPVDFADLAKHMTAHALKEHYDVHASIVNRWLSILNIKPIRLVPHALTTPMPDNFAEKARIMPIRGEYGLMKYYNVGLSVVKRWLKECGVAVPKISHNANKKNWADKPQGASIHFTEGEIALAAHFLRKFFANVHSTNIPMWEFCDKNTPNTWWYAKRLDESNAGKYYVSGQGIVDKDWVVEKAKEKGWVAA